MVAASNPMPPSTHHPDSRAVPSSDPERAPASNGARDWVALGVLTLAVTLNVLADVVLGLLPFMAGDVIDFFFRSYGRNMRLITGYVNGDKQVVAHVRRKAALSAVAIVVLLALLVVLMWLAWQLGQWVWQWLQQALQ